MIIGPSDEQSPRPAPTGGTERPADDAAEAKARKRARKAARAAKAARRAEKARAAAAAAEGRGDAGAGATPAGDGDGASPTPTSPEAGGASGPTVAPGGSADLVTRIDDLRDRIRDLVAIAGGDGDRSPGAGPGDGPGRPADGLAGPLSSHSSSTDAPAPVARHAPSADVPSAGPGAAPTGPAPPATAVLVARELLSGGMDPDAVRARLRDGYGVADPAAALALAAV